MIRPNCVPHRATIGTARVLGHSQEASRFRFSWPGFMPAVSSRAVIVPLAGVVLAAHLFSGLKGSNQLPGAQSGISSRTKCDCCPMQCHFLCPSFYPPPHPQHLKFAYLQASGGGGGNLGKRRRRAGVSSRLVCYWVSQCESIFRLKL